MKRLPGLLILLVISEVFGVICGQIFFGLFVKTVPPAVVTSFNAGAAHAAFIFYGVGMGLAIFVLALLAAGAARFLVGIKR